MGKRCVESKVSRAGVRARGRMCSRIAKAVGVGHRDARGIGQMQVLVWRHPRASLELRTPLQPLEAYHVPIRPNLEAECERSICFHEVPS